MGISGLLPFLKNATRETNIKEFRGCTVAIDSYCWLHKGAFSCAEKLALGEKTDQYVYYCMKFVNTLLSYDIKPVMVFDGCRLPSKREVEKQRREKRESYKKKAAQLLREGKRSEARDALKLSLDITSEMALNLMEACRNKGVDCIVAPYEADAQLAYLNKIGIAQVVVTEDSDLVLFGCEKIMYKMDFNGNGLLVEKKALNKTMDLRADLYSFEKFRYMCILSGCDYLSSLRGIGLKKAMLVFQRTRQSDMTTVIKKIPTTLNLNVSVGQDYIEGFFRANNTFLHQLVYDPLKRKQLPLNAYPDDLNQDDVQYAGPYMDDHRAYQLALGNLNVHDFSMIADFDPDTFQPKSNKWQRDSRLCMLSIWDRNYRPMSKINDNATSGSDSGGGNGQRTATKGMEVTVTVNLPGLKRKSPIKRQRPIEEEQDLMSKEELTNLYSSNETEIPLETESTVVKRRKNDSIVEMSLLPVKSDSNSVKENADIIQSNCDNMSDSFGSPENEAVVTQCTKTSPDLQSSSKKLKRINVFKATPSKNNKERFQLNATKTEVVSRFFTSAKNKFKKSKFFDQLEPHSTPSSDEELKSPTSKSLSQERRSSLDKNSQSQQEKNTHQSFTFKENQTEFGSSNNIGVKSSDSVCKQFKPVVDRTKLSKRLSDFSYPDSQGNASDVNTSFVNPSLSQGGDMYSIDGDSFELSQSQNTLAEDRGTNIEKIRTSSGSTQKPLFFLDGGQDNQVKEKENRLIDNELHGDLLETSPSQKNWLNGCKKIGLNKSSSNLAAGSSKKSRCRSSGLVKGSAAKTNHSQASIKTFFSNFSFNKNAKATLEKDRVPLSPKKDNI